MTKLTYTKVTKQERELARKLEKFESETTAKNEALALARRFAEKAIAKTKEGFFIAPKNRADAQKVKIAIARSASKFASIDSKHIRILEEAESAMLSALAFDFVFQRWIETRKISMHVVRLVFRACDRELRRMGRNADLENFEDLRLEAVQVARFESAIDYSRSQLPAFSKALSEFWKDQRDVAFRQNRKNFRSREKTDQKNLRSLLLNPKSYFEKNGTDLARNYRELAKRVNYGCALGEIDNAIPSAIDLRAFNTPKSKATV
jgi:hypothetical protein